jgi:hypothetical protein
VDSVVHPAYRGRGVGGQLIEARYDLARSLNLRGMIAGSVIRDYAAVADSVSAEAYVRDVIAGRRFDSNLSKQLIKGFRVHALVPNYTVDATSCGWGVLIVWENPDYRPTHRVSMPAQPRRYAVALKPARLAPLPVSP